MIAAKLVELRKSRGWTQQDLSDITLIPRSMISGYEIDIIPGKVNMKKILDAFELPEDYFYTIAVENKSSAIRSFDPVGSKMMNDLFELPKEEREIIFSMIQTIKQKYDSKKRSGIKKKKKPSQKKAYS
jgi:transcriptional regulator with XRE-family HTH domain